MSACPKCGALRSAAFVAFCPVCGSPLLDADGEPHASFARVGIPWESVEKLGVVRAASETISECLFSPYIFFSKLSPAHNAVLSFLFALVMGSTGSILGAVWTSLILSRFSASLPWLSDLCGASSPPGSGLILVPVLIAAKLAFSSLYFQTLLSVTGSKKQGIKSTFSILCYSESTAIFNIIPVVGSVVSLVWSLYVLTAGFNRVHRMSTIKAVVVIFLPLLLLGIIGILGIALVAGMIALFTGAFLT